MEILNTVKLYEEDSYLKELKSRIVGIDKERRALVLDKTIFFPTGGGQDHDTGTIGGLNVVDVVEEAGAVYHVLDDEIKFEADMVVSGDKVLSLGMEVDSNIDFFRRYDHMQQHTGEHILSGVILKEYGFVTRGFHIGSPYMRVDYSGYLDDEMLDKVLIKAAEVIREAVDVKVYKSSYEELENTEFRSKKHIEGAIRIVDCGIDVCACCATHVANTSEVGLLVCVSNEKYKNGSRLSLIAGGRAEDFVRKMASDLNRLSAVLSSQFDDLVESAVIAKDKLAKLDMENYALQKKLANMIFDSYTEGKSRLIYEENLSNKIMTALINRLSSEYGGYFAGISGVSGASDFTDYSFIVVDSKARSENIAKRLFGRFEIKGGGKGAVFQGKFKAKREELEMVVSSTTVEF